MLYRDEENQPNITVATKPAISLETIGVITWIVFMVFDYGYHAEWLNRYNPYPHFWTWFPLWAPIALSVAITLLVFLGAVIFALIYVAVEKRKMRNHGKNKDE